MISYVLLQFKEGYMDDAVFQAFTDVYTRIRNEVKGIQKVTLKRGDRTNVPEAMDIMIIVEAEDLDALNRYIHSDIHTDHQKIHGPNVTGDTRFDFEGHESANFIITL